ncbi:glycoside hydrolase family 64 protein [Lepidopterella palustris CBS 459.81]|uniref:Glycoside hydrolase family 64 protein n=1 Tax=Lepidopterella palustris CBS 459.81 TaxID=1314670 RepID=A0A8E2DYC4_9PEZI|nr:glycoside hydrolase family 64 protein [Lepidopterella palustris CBS 459.81]
MPVQIEHQVARSASQRVLAAAPGTLNIALQNQTSSNTVYAYITGLAINNNNAPVLLQSDGHTLYYPQSPSSTGAPLAADCAIRLGAPGSTTTVNIPKIAGGRIWFSIDAPLVFLLNPGPALVEPSVTNYSDPNINISWAFCEFTYNDSQLFANISYVDFVSIPVALTLQNTSGGTQHISGMPASGLTTVCNNLRTQAAVDNQPWDQLIYSNNGQPLRALAPNNLIVTNNTAFANYWDPYVQQVWSKFSSTNMEINSQSSYGNIYGQVSNGMLNLNGAGSFNQPSAGDIFTCNTGPFATGSNTERNIVIPRLAAAFNRSTLLLSNEFPNGITESQYYQDPITNHYARIVHNANLDGKGYSFPYDDVVPDGGSDQAGIVSDGSPSLLTVTVGGTNAYT